MHFKTAALPRLARPACGGGPVLQVWFLWVLCWEEADCLLPEPSGVSSGCSCLESGSGSTEAEWAPGQGWQLACQVGLLPRTLLVLLAAPQWRLQPAQRGPWGLSHLSPDFPLEGPTPQLPEGRERPSLQLGPRLNLVASLSGSSCWSTCASAPQFFLPRKMRALCRGENANSRISVFPGGQLLFKALLCSCFPRRIGRGGGADQLGEL